MENKQDLSSKSILTLEEVALFTGLSKSALYKMTSNKQIRHFKPKKKLIYFLKQDVIEFLLSNPIEKGGAI